MSKINFSEELKINFMKQALVLAKKAMGLTNLNPLVGAILAQPNGNVISKGYYKQYNSQHAEHLTLNGLDEIPPDAGLFVSLEPCSKRKNNKSCCDLILEKKIKYVVYGCTDENPIFRGSGIEYLRSNGVITELSVLHKQAKKLNRVFFHHINTKTSFLALKVAISLDGKISLNNNQSKWISNDISRLQVAKLRNYYQSVTVGKNTLDIDNPRLNVRNIKYNKQPTRIVVSSFGIFNDSSNFAKESDNNSQRIVISGCDIALSTEKKLFDNNIKLIKCSDKIPSFKEIKQLLYKNNIVSSLLEGGSKLITSAIKENSVDYLHCFISPRFIGNDGVPFIGNLSKIKLEDPNQTNWQLMNFKRFNDDIYLEYKKK